MTHQDAAALEGEKVTSENNMGKFQDWGRTQQALRTGAGHCSDALESPYECEQLLGSRQVAWWHAPV